MYQKFFISFLLVLLFALSVFAQKPESNSDTLMVLPFENKSGNPEFNWIGESIADSLSDLLKVPGLNVISNEERKLVQQRLNIPLTNLPSLATSLRLARESKSSLLVAGKYSIIPALGEVAASISVTARIIRVNEGRFLSEELPDGRKITLSDALSNLQTIEGQMAYQVLYQRDKALAFSESQFKEAANKIPARAFEAYIKGLLSTNLETRENFYKNAIRLYTEAKQGETYAAVSLELGHLYLNQKKQQDAVDFFSKVPQGDEHYAEAAFYIGLIYWQQNNYEQALAVLQPLADDLVLTSVYNTIGAISVQSSRTQKKDKSKAALLLKDGISFLKKASESQPDDAVSRFNYGLALFADNNFREAILQLRPVLASNPRDGEAYFLLAKALEKTADVSAKDFDDQARRFMTNYAKSETEFRRSNSTESIPVRIEQPVRNDFVSIILRKKQNSPLQSPVDETTTLLIQAKGFYRAGQDDEAMTALRKILNSEPMNAESRLIVGKIHLRSGDLDQAVTQLKTALFWDNRLIEAHILLGRIFLDKKDCLSAKNYAASAAEIDENNSEVVALQRLAERCGR
jgi:tetratricopeptide (TPR) repeat protein/TolB-like protein